MHSTIISRLMTSGSLIGMIAAVAVPSAAQAQTAAADQAQTAAVRAADESTIVVTARKREEALIEVPLAVTVFNQDQLEARGVNSLADISAFTPGFDFQETGQGGASGRDNPSIRFRGVAVQNENPASRAGAVFFNGSYLSGGAGLLPTFDLQRVEIIKGPQNALYGRNTFAGAVNFLPAEPGDKLEGFVNGLYSPSDQDTYQIQGAISIPIAENLGIRVGGQYRRAGADFTFGNGDPLGTEETTSLQGTLLYDNKAGVRLKTTGYWVDASDTRATVSISANTAPGDCDITYSGNIRNVVTGDLVGSFSTNLANIPVRTICGQVPDYDGPGGFRAPSVGSFANGVALDPFSGSVDYYRTLPPEAANYNIPTAPNGNGNAYRTWLINQSGEFELPGGHVFSAIASYGENASYRVRDSQDGALGNNQRLTAFAFYSHDLFVEGRISSPQDQRVRYQAGFSYYSGASRTFEFSPFAGATFFGPSIDDQALNFVNSDVLGVFGTVDVDVTSDITLSLEGRYGTDKTTILYNGPTLRDFGPGDVLPDAIRNVSQSFTKFMPRVLLQYNPSDKLNVYANWAISYLQGSDTNVSDYAAAVPGSGIDPTTFGLITPVQRLNAFEVGVKAQPMSNLSLAVAGFYMDWENQVQFELSPFTFVPLFSAGDSRYKGIEAEATYTPVEWLRLEGNVTYVDAELTDFAGAGSLATAVLARGQLPPGGQISSNGNRPRYIPVWSSALAGTVRFNKLLGFDNETFLRVDGVYFGNVFIDNFEFNESPGFWRFNARLSSQLTNSIRLDFYGLNLTNDLSFSAAGGDTAGPTVAGIASRRTFGGLPRARELGLEIFVKF